MSFRGNRFRRVFCEVRAEISSPHLGRRFKSLRAQEAVSVN